MEPFLAEIQIFPYTFAPRGWAYCDGTLLTIAQYSSVFALLGVIYGGDAKTNFALPNLKGRVPMHWGTGPGLTPRSIGQQSGVESVTLTEAQMPSHTHPMQADATNADKTAPASAVLAQGYVSGSGRKGGQSEHLYTASTANATLNPGAVQSVGGGQPHTNMQPCLALNFCIALQGIFPMRS